jgi:hypothetical protein
VPGNQPLEGRRVARTSCSQQLRLVQRVLVHSGHSASLRWRRGGNGFCFRPGPGTPQARALAGSIRRRSPAVVGGEASSTRRVRIAPATSCSWAPVPRPPGTASSSRSKLRNTVSMSIGATGDLVGGPACSHRERTGSALQIGNRISSKERHSGQAQSRHHPRSSDPNVVL